MEADRALVTCVHHWRIAEPGAPNSEGVCVNCGATREFGNTDEAIADLRMGRQLNYKEFHSRSPRQQPHGARRGTAWRGRES